MPPIIIFDLYDTILKDISFDFNRGIEYLYNIFFVEKCSLSELKDYSSSFKPLYDERRLTNNELCFIRDELPLLFKKFDLCPDIDEATLDYNIMNHMQKEILLDEVRETLDMLHSKGIHMYILSNSIFLASSNQRLLDEFGVGKYFRKVYSSADFGKRKPDKSFFKYALDDIYSQEPYINSNEIFYVGNDYNTDVIGSQNVGLKTIWYNVQGLLNTNELNIFDIRNFTEITSIIFPQ